LCGIMEAIKMLDDRFYTVFWILAAVAIIVLVLWLQKKGWIAATPKVGEKK
jgi:hypothetical protein